MRGGATASLFVFNSLALHDRHAAIASANPAIPVVFILCRHLPSSASWPRFNLDDHNTSADWIKRIQSAEKSFV